MARLANHSTTIDAMEIGSNNVVKGLDVAVCGEAVQLLAERAIYWPRQRTLLVADVHLGKAATFQHFGLGVPDGADAGTTRDDLARLTQLIGHTGAERLVVLGDLLHGPYGQAAHLLEQVSQWRAQHAALDLLLVRGNHDRRAGDPPDDWRVTCVEQPWADAPFCYRHEPATDPAPSACGYSLAGHVHPAVTLSGRGKLQTRLPCFVLGANSGLLPAFGSFTGSASRKPKTGERVFVIAGDEVVQV